MEELFFGLDELRVLMKHFPADCGVCANVELLSFLSSLGFSVTCSFEERIWDSSTVQGSVEYLVASLDLFDGSGNHMTVDIPPLYSGFPFHEGSCTELWARFAGIENGGFEAVSWTEAVVSGHRIVLSGNFLDIKERLRLDKEAEDAEEASLSIVAVV